MSQKIPITVINLKKDTDRKAHITQQLNSLNFEFCFFEAIYGADLSDKEFDIAYNPKNSIKMGRGLLSKNEIGCALSHFGIYQKMLDDDIDKMIILEDDVTLDQEFKKALSIIDCLPKNWELFLLNYQQHLSNKKELCNFNIKLKNNPTLFDIKLSPTFRSSAAAYVINKRGAKRMLSYKDFIYQALDYYTGNYKFMNVYIIYPKVVKHSYIFNSSIGGNRADITNDCAKENHKAKWKQQKIVKIIRNFNYKRRRKRHEQGKFSCIMRKINFRIKYRFKG